MTDERWIVIQEAPNYEVSSKGRVRRVSDHFILRHKVKPKGYHEVALTFEKRKFYRLVHRLVCFAFHGPAPLDKPFSCHENDISDDNREGNLAWGSRASNAKDALRNNRYLRGSKCGSSKYTEQQILALIKDRQESGASLDVLTGRHPMSRGHIGKILSGQYWKHVQ